MIWMLLWLYAAGALQTALLILEMNGSRELRFKARVFLSIIFWPVAAILPVLGVFLDTLRGNVQER